MEEVYQGFLTHFLSCILSLSSTGQQVIPDTWKKKPDHNQHCFISLFFMALNIFSVIGFLKYSLKLLLCVRNCASCFRRLPYITGQHSSLIPCALESLSPAHTGILQVSQGQGGPTQGFHLWCHAERQFQYHTTSPTSLLTFIF